MRIFVCLLLCASVCRPQSAESAVAAVFRQMEHAEQTGDAQAFAALWARESAGNAQQMAQHLRPNPQAHYTASTVLVQGDQAALLGQMGPTFASVTFVKQDGGWKMKDLVFSGNPLDPDSIYALLPPPQGAFDRAGSPWANVPGAMSAADAARRGWQIRAAHDESYLYIRIESAKPLPPPGSSAETPPGGWPVMKLSVAGNDRVTVNATVNIGDQASFDETGRANSHRHFVAYGMIVTRGDHLIFQTGMQPEPLVQVDTQAIVLRIPLRTLGVADGNRANIVVGDASWPKSAIFSVAAGAYK